MSQRKVAVGTAKKSQAAASQTEDAKETMRAFREKRAPKFDR